jgi:hypothetical protein
MTEPHVPLEVCKSVARDAAAQAVEAYRRTCPVAPLIADLAEHVKEIRADYYGKGGDGIAGHGSLQAVRKLTAWHNTSMKVLIPVVTALLIAAVTGLFKMATNKDEVVQAVREVARVARVDAREAHADAGAAADRLAVGCPDANQAKTH